MGWLETLLKSFTEHAVFNVHLCLWNFNCIVFSSEKINYWGIEKTFVRKEGKVLDSSYCFVLFTNHCICFNILLVTAQDFKCEKKNLLLSLSLDLHNVGYIFLFSWVPGHNLWFHISSLLQITFLHLVRGLNRTPALTTFPMFQMLTNPLRHLSVNGYHKILPAWGKYLFAIQILGIPIKFTNQDAGMSKSHVCFCKTFLHSGKFHLPFVVFSYLILDLSYSLCSLLISQLVLNHPIQKLLLKLSFSCC